MQILREESSRRVEDSSGDDGGAPELGASLLAQYDSIGADLRALVQAWETGRAALAANIERQERRVSQASSSGGGGGGMRSPAPSLGGLTVVEEGCGGGGGGGSGSGSGSPGDALRALNGEGRPRSSLSMSGESTANSASDEEVFEAIAVPRQRAPTSSREERVLKMQEERARQAVLREKREASMNMVKELESVIHLRPKRLNAQRITSI